LSAEIRARAQTFGFDAIGITRAQADAADRRNLARYVAEGRHGDMDWMARDIDRRADPQVIWPEARSIICVGVNYGPAEDPLCVHHEPERGAISVYARGRDYHDVLKKRLKAFGRWVASAYECEVKIFVDTAAVMEKPLAMRAGLGWVGKHTNLVSRRFGSWLFLGEVFTTLDLVPDLPEVDHCGSCDACVRACPTDALSEPYRIDPRRCIAYLTVEHKGAVPPGMAESTGNRIFGCDDCLAACPWNKFATPTPHVELRPRSDLAAPRLADLAKLGEDQFKRLFAGTAIRRTGYQRMMRNVRIATDNQGTSRSDRHRPAMTKPTP
jgi:epoxyqueuosine reductase